MIDIEDDIKDRLNRLSREGFGRVSYQSLDNEQLAEIINLPSITRLSLNQLTDIRVLTLDLTGNLSSEMKLLIFKIFRRFGYEFKVISTLRETKVQFSSGGSSIEYPMSSQEVFNLFFHLAYNGSSDI